MKKVVILSAFLTPFRSGAEACAEEVALRLSESFDVAIVTAKLRPDLSREDLLRGKVRVVRVGVGSSADKWLYPFLAPFAARRLRPDLIHAVLETFAGLALALCRAVVPSARRLLTLQTTNSSFLRTFVLRGAHRVTAISRILADDAAARGVAGVPVIPNGIDLPAIRAAVDRRQKVPGRLLFVGRLEPMKGVDTLLSAVATLKDPAWSLHVVGDGSLRSSLEALARSLSLGERVRFIGRLADAALWAEYAEAEIFCGLSRSEALGNVFLEAQAAECAVVATTVGGIPEIVKDGEAGILVTPDDPEAAAGAIAALRDPARRAAIAGAGARFASAYDWAAIAARYADVYASLLS